MVEAARRRVARNVSPDPGVVGETAVRQVVERFLDQVARRRESYVALVLGQAPIARASGDDPVETVREHVAGVVARATDLPDAALPAVHGWVAYLEDRALQWSARPAPSGMPAGSTWSTTAPGRSSCSPPEPHSPSRVLERLPGRPPEHPTPRPARHPIGPPASG